LGLEALGISDHDTLDGYDEAVPLARDLGVELVCGIEISTKLSDGSPRGKTVHLLGYFLSGHASAGFRTWMKELHDARRDRNLRLIDKLQSVGVDIRLEEVVAIGRNMTARPHFAQALVAKGYVKTLQEAFDVYLDESARAFVTHESPSLAESIRKTLEGGGLPVLAHPVRLGRKDPRQEEELIAAQVDQGLGGIEVYHSDHSPQDVERYKGLARRFGLAITGGSDFHGAAKPHVALGTGKNGNVSVPLSVLDHMRAAMTSSSALTPRSS